MHKFTKSDADMWFQRNQGALNNLEQNNDTTSTIIGSLLPKYFHKGIQLLEIGCGNGARLNDLYLKNGGTFYGVDISQKAIDNGSKRFQGLNLSVQNASSLDFLDNQFDFVFLGFFLYLVDRKDYEQVISEADRVLKPGGFVAILDFDVPVPYENVYSHNIELRSYKCDNSIPFLTNGNYSLIEKKMFSHDSLKFPRNVDERVSLQVLYKETT